MAAGAGKTVGTIFRQTVRRFTAANLRYGHGTSNARDEAAYLILHSMGLPLDSLRANLGRTIPPAKLRQLEGIIRRRIRERIPAAYLTHEAWLGEFSFYVDRRTIIPRSFIAELLRGGLQPWLRRPVRRALDLCTGSGCLAVLLAHFFPRARVDAVDLSRDALAVARRNIERYGLHERVRLLRSDLFAELSGERYDLILANPPYVTARAMHTLPAEYRYEPNIALAGGHDGLDFVKEILRQSPEHLAQRGLLVCEVGHNARTLERSYPRIPFVWPQTASGAGYVFVLEREAFAPPLPQGARGGRRARPRQTRG